MGIAAKVDEVDNSSLEKREQIAPIEYFENKDLKASNEIPSGRSIENMPMPSANQFASALNIQAKPYASNGAEKVTTIESLHHKKPVIQSQQPNRALNTDLKPIYSFSKSESNFILPTSNYQQNQHSNFNPTMSQNFSHFPRVSTPLPMFPVEPNFSSQGVPIYSQQFPMNNNVCLQSNSNPQALFSPAVMNECSPNVPNRDSNSWQNSMVTALRQIASTPKIEYMRFDGDPLKYVTFIHNFETCLEKDNPDDSRKLQLLIQHCDGKAREAIESCANLFPEEGYLTARETLRENFGKPHVIAGAHIKKLESLPKLKTADGPSLLEFTRNLEVADRTLTGMGPQYASDLNHMHTLRELAKKLPLFLRSKWTERAGIILESGCRPRFSDFVSFVKQRAKLVDNEFGKDMSSESPRDKSRNQKKEKTGITIFATGVEPSTSKETGNETKTKNCVVCLERRHGLWKCDKFKTLSYEQKREIVQRHKLCNKCLSAGHFAKSCPRVNFRCQIPECGKGHHTLMHRNPRCDNEQTTVRGNEETGAGNDARSNTKKAADHVTSAVTGAGNGRVCLGVVPVKVQAIKGEAVIKTYALLDNGSEATLCHKTLAQRLKLKGNKSKFTLTGMTGSKEIESELVNITVKSLDETVKVQLSNVKTVDQMPIPASCIPRNEDLTNWSHLKDVSLGEIETKEVMLLIGLKDQPSIFIPLEFRIGKPDEPVAVRYSLGWTVMGPVGGQESCSEFSVNFVQQRMRNFQVGNLQKGQLYAVSPLTPSNNLPDELRSE